MTYRTPLVIAILLASLFTGCSKRPAPAALASSASMVIQPGASIGPVHSGMTMQEVVSELGPPQETNGPALEYWNLGFSVIGREGKVHIVLCVNPSGQKGPFKKAFSGRTAQGIGIGSSRADVVRAYGKPSSTEIIKDEPEYEVLRYDSPPLYFRLRDGNVDTIGVIFHPK